MTQAIQVANAKLPATYSRAKAALAKCEKIDECKEWRNKAAAIASYAKQANDESMYRMASKIRARAIRRMGELLREVEPDKGGRPKTRNTGDPRSGRKSAARAAGLGQRQQMTAQRIANISEADFEAAFEEKKVPSIKTLVDRGKGRNPAKPLTAHLKGRKPDEYKASRHVRGAMARFTEECERVTPTIAVRGAMAYDWVKMRKQSKKISKWIERVQRELEKKR